MPESVGSYCEPEGLVTLSGRAAYMIVIQFTSEKVLPVSESPNGGDVVTFRFLLSVV